MVREAQKVEGPRPIVTPVVAVGPMKRHESRLLQVQRQAVLAESLRQDLQESLGIMLVVEQHDEVIRIPEQLSTTRESRLNVSDEPLVEHVVQVDVRKEG